MNKREIVTVAGFLVSVLTLLFGDNIYQQITGHSFYGSRDIPKLEPTPITVIQPTNTLAPTATPKPVWLGRIRIPGNAEEGVRFTANQDGQYIFTYAGVAYSPWPTAEPTQPKWRTRISVYKNRSIVWAQRPYNPEDDRSIIYKEPSDTDDIIGNYDVATQAEAMNAAQSVGSLRFDLRAGDYLIFVVSDDQGWYNNPGSNVGEVAFEVTFISR